MKKALFCFLICISFVLAAEKLEIEKPVLGKLIEKNGLQYDTFYYSIDGRPQYLLQKYDEIAIPYQKNLNSLKNIDLNGIKLSEILSNVTFNAQNFRAFKIKTDKPDRKNWIHLRNILAKNGVAAWPVLTYHAKNAPVVLNGTMDLVFPGNMSKAEQEKILDIYGLKVVEIVDEEANFYTVSLPAGTDPFAIANSLFERRFVRWSQPNWLWHIKPLSTTTNDPYFSDHLNNIKAPEAWDTETAEGKDVRIAIVDTGVDLTHPDLNVLTELGKDYLGELGGAPNYEEHGDDHRGVPHGTACAGLAAAKTNNGTGVSATCWGCPVIPVRLVPDTPQSVSTSTFYEAMKYVTDNGAWVVNNSWNSQDTDDDGNCIATPAINSIAQGVDYGRSKGRNGKGTIFIWSAGNSHCDTTLNELLKDNDLLTISALKPNTSDHDIMASYSNYGSEIDISAPAGNRTTDIQGKDYGYAYNGSYSLDSNGDYTNNFSGTSAAAPVTSGAVALMLAANPAMTFSGAMNCIKISARKPATECNEGEWTVQDDEWIAAGSKEHSPCFGFGVVDAKAMVENAKNSEICPLCIPIAATDGCFGNYAYRDDDCDGTVDNNCSSGGTGKAGDACTADSDCINTAATPECLTGEDWAGGYCSAKCTKNADCYNGNSKVECSDGYCIAKCTYNTIREGYQCISNKILPKEKEPDPICGNGILEAGEECDGDYVSCQVIDSSFTGGSAFCNDSCTAYDTSTCAAGEDPDDDTEDDSDTLPDEDNGDSCDSSDSGETGDSGDSGDSSDSGETSDSGDSEETGDSGDSGSEENGSGETPDDGGKETSESDTDQENSGNENDSDDKTSKKSASGGCSLLIAD